MDINPAQPGRVRPLRATQPTRRQQLQDAERLQQVYREFVGKTFFGQMLKAMRTAAGKPAYFHGGQTEEVFRAQLDQTLAEHMTEASADQIADPMFRHQFPRQASLLGAEQSRRGDALADLDQLRRS